MSADHERFARAISLFDGANSEDPRLDQDGGEAVPRELLYARRMSEMLERYAPEAPETVKLAVRAQHIQRWKTPRESYPMDRAGYMQWRTGLYAFHAETAARLDIIRKTWRKMSDRAHEFALSGRVRLPAPLVPLIKKAIGAP